MVKIPDLQPGDLVKVYSKIIEGDKERVTPFQGVVIQIKGSDIHKTVTVRKISAGVGIERIFPLKSPMITKIEIKKKGKVRRAKLSYLRQRQGRKMKIKESAVPESLVETTAEKLPQPDEAKEPQKETAEEKEPVAETKKDVPEKEEKEKDKGSKEKSSESTTGQKSVEKT
jgi:large subunit ribosomal protein L19